MAQEILSPTIDYIFSLIFGDQRNIDIVTAFLKTVLDIPEDEYDRLTIVNPALKRIFRKDKMGIVDVRLTTRSGKVLHIELQVKKNQTMRNRIIWYLSKLFWEQMKSGDKWGKLNQVISIVICDHVLIPEESDYLNTYSMLNEKTGKQFTDLLKVITLELPKVSREEGQEPVWPWLKFFKCRTEGEYDMLAKKHPEVGKAVKTLKTLSWSERRRDIAFHRWLRRVDEETEMAEFQEEIAAKVREAETKVREAETKTHEIETKTHEIETKTRKAEEKARQEKLEAAQKLKARGFSDEDISGILQIAIEDIAGL
jgi:predicted transposase/invertase (TIGR01784 family)